MSKSDHESTEQEELVQPVPQTLEKPQNDQLTVNIIAKVQKKSKFEINNTNFKSLIPLVFLSAFPVFMETGSTNLSLPQIAVEFGLEKNVAQWAITIFYLAQASVGIPIAKISDNFGQKRVFLIGNIILSITLLSQMFIQNFYLLCFVKFITGAGCSCLTANRTIFIRRLAPQAKGAEYLIKSGIVLNAIGIITSLLNGFLVDISWRVPPIVCAVFVSLATFFIIPYPEIRTPTKLNFDYLGTLLLLTSVASMYLSFTLLGSQLFIWFAVLLIVSILLGLIFFKVEKFAKDPVLSIEVIKTPVLQYILMNFCQFLVQMTYNYILPQTLAFLDKKVSIMGVMQMIISIIMFVVQCFLTTISKRFLNKYIVVFAFSCMITVTCVSGIFAGDLVTLLILFIIISIFAQLGGNQLYPMVIMAAPTRYALQVAALPLTTRTIASGLSTCISSAIMEMVYNLLKTQQHDDSAWANSIRINIALIIVFSTTTLILIITQTGFSKAEIGKKGFDIDKVIELRVQDNVIVELKQAVI